MSRLLYGYQEEDLSAVELTLTHLRIGATSVA